MHKPAINIAVPTATIATVVMLPHAAFGAMTLLAIAVAVVMTAWSILYLKLQSRKRADV